MRSVIQDAKYLLPKEQIVQLDNTATVPVVTFDFATHLLSLLQDKSLMQWDNLCLDPTDPFEAYSTVCTTVNECNSGLCYHNMYEYLQIDKTKNELLCPLI